MDWTLSFKESAPVTIELCEQALSRFVGGPVSTDVPDFSGNPRDGFFRNVTITAPCPARDMTLELSLRQDGWVSTDHPETSLRTLQMRAPRASFETKYQAWQDLHNAFWELGWYDRTLLSGAHWIIDDAEAAGESNTAMFLRIEATQAQIAYAKNPDHAFEVRLSSPRADDINAILEAYGNPQRIVHMHLDDCGLRELPRAFARFPNLELLSLDENPIDSSVLRVSLPKLYMLTLSRTAITTLTRDDLAGFPELKHLGVQHTPLREIDLEACPKLETFDVRETPLANNSERVTALRATMKVIT